MKFLLFVEGESEKKGLSLFFKRWLDPRLRTPIRIKIRGLNGCSNLTQRLVRSELGHKDNDDVFACLALLDFYGLSHANAPLRERYESKVRELERQVDHPKFKMFLAVHETEAWLLSQPRIFPVGVKEAIASDKRKPESVNFNEPPAKYLDRLYRKHTKHTYRKTVNGPDLFSRLDPEIAYSACPSLAGMLDQMLSLAKEAGL